MMFDVGPRDVAPRDFHPAFVGRTQARQRFDEFGLAVARDAGNADDFAGADGESSLGRPPACLRPAPSAHRPVSIDGAKLRRAFLDRQIDSAARHRADDLARRGFRCRRRNDDASVAQNRHAVGDRHYSRAVCA